MPSRKTKPQGPGYYPGYRCLDNAAAWDEATRRTVLARLEPHGPLRFFTPEVEPLWRAVIARMMPQDDRDPELRIPVLEVIDQRLAEGRIEGYRYEDMPPDGEAYRLAGKGIEEIARALFGRSFVDLNGIQQDRVLLAIHDAKPPEPAATWRRLPADRFWRILMDDVLAAYYEHPYAWDEIGFGGPAYPKGYMRLDHGEPEPWEKPERRYGFAAPADSLSGAYTPLGKMPRPKS